MVCQRCHNFDTDMWFRESWKKNHSFSFQNLLTLWQRRKFMWICHVGGGVSGISSGWVQDSKFHKGLKGHCPPYPQSPNRKHNIYLIFLFITAWSRLKHYHNYSCIVYWHFWKIFPIDFSHCLKMLHRSWGFFFTWMFSASSKLF